jgi:flagellin-specific chaperone FliS
MTLEQRIVHYAMLFEMYLSRAERAAEVGSSSSAERAVTAAAECAAILQELRRA